MSQRTFFRYSIGWFAYLLSFLLIISCSFAQTPESPTFLQKNVKFSGQANVYGELYGISGSASRRPPSTGRITFSPHLQLAKLLSVSMHMMLSTEGSSTRQNMNILGLHPSWKWGKAHLGDYSENFSRYSFNGVNIKGAEIDLFPNKFRFTVGGGQSRRAVEGILVSESYAQYMLASRIGYGESNGTFLDLIFVRTKDDPASIKKPEDWEYPYIIPDTMETELDTIWVEPPYNPLSVTPQENMVLGVNARIEMMKKRVSLEIEGTGSAFTNDLNAEIIEMDEIEKGGFVKDIFGGLYTPRVGSNFDYALNTQLGLNFSNLRCNVGFRHIGPGYVSLGIPSTVNDREELLFNTAFKAGIHRFRFNWNRLSDNLSGQKLQTNIRNQFQTSISSVTRSWRSQINFRYLLMNADTDYDSLRWDFNNLNFSTHQTLTFGRDAIFRQIGIQYTLQSSRKSMAQRTDESFYHTVNLTSGLRFAGHLSMNASMGLSFRKSAGSENTTTQVYSVRMNHVAFENKLTNSLFVSSNMVRDTRMFRVGLTSNYRLAQKYRLTLNLSYNHFNGTRNFQEYRSSLMLSHQF